LIGEFIPKGSPKDIIFLATVFFQGFSNELMQFTIFRYVVNFGYGDVSKYNNGTSISSVFTSLLALMVFLFVEDNLTAALVSVIVIGFVMIACV
jgi:VIT1/CCC1 family predicted Fe2+/Mn2+ transporter